MYSSKMILYCQILMFFIYLNSIVSALKNKDKPCKQYNYCNCIFPTGRGLNLHVLNTTLSVQLQPNKTMYLHLCENVAFGKNGSSNNCFNNPGTVCLEDNGSNQTTSLGKVENLKFISESQFRPISLRYLNEAYTTNIALICSEDATVPKLSVKDFSGTTYNLELTTSEACVRVMSMEEGPTGGLSTGSVLVIMLLVFILVYFGGGMLTLRLLRGAEGREMIPNIDFWTDLPYLVRDGILFAMNGFRPPPTYDRI